MLIRVSISSRYARGMSSYHENSGEVMGQETKKAARTIHSQNERGTQFNYPMVFQKNQKHGGPVIILHGGFEHSSKLALSHIHSTLLTKLCQLCISRCGLPVQDGVLTDWITNNLSFIFHAALPFQLLSFLKQHTIKQQLPCNFRCVFSRYTKRRECSVFQIFPQALPPVCVWVHLCLSTCTHVALCKCGSPWNILHDNRTPSACGGHTRRLLLDAPRQYQSPTATVFL